MKLQIHNSSLRRKIMV